MLVYSDELCEKYEVVAYRSIRGSQTSEIRIAFGLDGWWYAPLGTLIKL